MIGTLIATALVIAPQANVSLAPPSAVSEAAAIDPTRLAAARALVQTMRSEAQMRAQQAQGIAGAEQSLDRFLPAQATMRAQINDPQGFASAKAQAIKIIAEDRQQIADQTIPLMIDAEARRYATHFTLDELRQLDAFYRSPLGQRLIAEQPRMAADSNQFQQTVLQPVIAAHSAGVGAKLAVALAPILRQAPQPAPPVAVVPKPGAKP